VLGEISKTAALSDEEVVARVRAGDTDLYEILMRRYNQRLYRVTRSILRDEAEAEDVMQQAYVNAYLHLDQFEDRASFATWLTKIAVYEALARARRRSRFQPAESTMDEYEDTMSTLRTTGTNPERQALAGEIGRLLESAIDGLPEHYRSVLVMRDVEGMSTADTAESLAIAEETVKTRLHRARMAVRGILTEQAGLSAPALFHFNADRCDRVVLSVLAAIAGRAPGSAAASWSSQ
jgi:RNA polymerase sigma-70 factor (ECF subfamily)